MRLIAPNVGKNLKLVLIIKNIGGMTDIEKDANASLRAALEAKEEVNKILRKRIEEADNILRQCHNMLAGINALMPEDEILRKLSNPTSSIERQIIHWRRNRS